MPTGSLESGGFDCLKLVLLDCASKKYRSIILMIVFRIDKPFFPLAGIVAKN